MRPLGPVQLRTLFAMAAALWLPLPAYPQADDGRIQVVAEPELENYVAAIHTICTYAVEQAEEAGLTLPDTITVQAVMRESYPSFVVVRGDSIVFQVYRELDLGASLRKPPWVHRFMKVRDLMTAVLDVATDSQYPAITDMLSAVYLVPGLFEAYGPQVWPQAYDYYDYEGPQVYTDRLQSPLMVELSAGTELAALAYDVAEGHGPPGLCEALAKAIADEDPERDAAAKLEEALVEVTGDEALRDWIESYRRLAQVEPEEDGSVLLFGFEDQMELDTWNTGPNFQAAVVADHATQGNSALRLATADGVTGWSVFTHVVPRWRLGDWREFSGLALDVYNHNNTEEQLRIELHDCHRRSHGKIQLTVRLAPQAATEVVLPFDGARTFAEYIPGDVQDLGLYEGAFRFGAVSEIALVRRPDAGPVVLDVDNVRLVP